MKTFSVWLLEELDKRDWSPATLSKKSGVNPGSLSHILNGTRKAGVDTCLAMARALNVPPEKVLREAGLLPPLPGPEEDVKFKELLEVVKHLSPEMRQEVLEYAFWQYQRQQKREAKQRNEGANASTQARA